MAVVDGMRQDIVGVAEFDRRLCAFLMVVRCKSRECGDDAIFLVVEMVAIVVVLVAKIGGNSNGGFGGENRW